MEAVDTRRRNLSGIYIFDTLPQDSKRKPTCIEDCTEATRLEWLKQKSKGKDGLTFLRNTAKLINETFLRVWSYLEESERGDNQCPFIETSGRSIGALIDDINRKCILLHRLAVAMDIFAPDSEADTTCKEND